MDKLHARVEHRVPVRFFDDTQGIFPYGYKVFIPHLKKVEDNRCHKANASHDSSEETILFFKTGEIASREKAKKNKKEAKHCQSLTRMITEPIPRVPAQVLNDLSVRFWLDCHVALSRETSWTETTSRKPMYSFLYRLHPCRSQSYKCSWVKPTHFTSASTCSSRL